MPTLPARAAADKPPGAFEIPHDAWTCGIEACVTCEPCRRRMWPRGTEAYPRCAACARVAAEDKRRARHDAHA